MIFKDACSLEESYDKPRQHIKKQRHHFTNKGLYSQSYGFSSSHVQMWKLDHKEDRMPKNWCFHIVVLEKTLESPLDSNQSILKEISWCWSWSSKTLATWCKEPTYWKRPWCWGRLRAGEEGDRGWDGWMASSTQWTWVRANSERWWRTGKPGVLQCMEWKIAGQQLNKNNKNAACMGFPGSSAVENLPSKQETWQEPWVWSLGWDDPLEKEMATCSSILAWETPWTEEPSGLQSMGWQRVRHDWVAKQQQ